MPEEHQHKAAGARRVDLDCEARDPARARLLRQLVRFLPRLERAAAHAERRARETGPEREVA